MISLKLEDKMASHIYSLDKRKFMFSRITRKILLASMRFLIRMKTQSIGAASGETGKMAENGINLS